MAYLQGRKWFDCAECHAEQEDHHLLRKTDMVGRMQYIFMVILMINMRLQTFACKKCKKCFRKDTREFEDWYSSRQMYICVHN